MRHAFSGQEEACPPCVAALLGVLFGFTVAVHSAFGTAPREARFSWIEGLSLMLVGGAVGLALAALWFLLRGAAGLVLTALSPTSAGENRDNMSLRRAHG